jgi:hypothetical protein
MPTDFINQSQQAGAAAVACSKIDVTQHGPDLEQLLEMCGETK